MTVICNQESQKFAANEIVFAKKEMIDAVVKAALVNQTGAFIDMIIDTERPEDITRAGVNETLRGVKDSARDFLVNALKDLETAILARLEEANYGAVVTGIKYDIAGDVVDLEIDVSVS